MKKPTEKDFTRTVIKLAQAFGFRVAHFRPGRVVRRGVEKYETPVAGDGKGFPDLLLVHPKRRLCIVAELKMPGGKFSPEQVQWLQDFAYVGVLAYRWGPADMDEIEAVLRGDPEATT